MWRARLKHVTGTRTRRELIVGRGGMAEAPDPMSLGIVRDGAGYALLRYDASGIGLGHTWHASIEGARAQAASTYGISEDEWIDDAE